MLQELFANSMQELRFGYLKKKHPFRYFSFVTKSEDYPAARTVVLRGMTDKNELLIYTDFRSQKVKQLQFDQSTTAIFYHPKKLLQILVKGKTQLITSGKEWEDHKSRIQGNSKKDYLTEQTPGSLLKNPDEVNYQEKMHFALLKLIPHEIEVLQLKRPNHLRAKFELKDEFKASFITP